MKEFKDKLREKRCESGLSQQKLADMLFVSRSAVAKWENGLGYPSDDCREQIKALFEVGDDFFRAEEPEKILCEKNRKLRSLRVRGFVLSGLAMLVMILLPIIFVAHMWGYRLTPFLQPERMCLCEYRRLLRRLIIQVSDEFKVPNSCLCSPFVL